MGCSPRIWTATPQSQWSGTSHIYRSARLPTVSSSVAWIPGGVMSDGFLSLSSISNSECQRSPAWPRPYTKLANLTLYLLGFASLSPVAIATNSCFRSHGELRPSCMSLGRQTADLLSVRTTRTNFERNILRIQQYPFFPHKIRKAAQKKSESSQNPLCFAMFPGFSDDLSRMRVGLGEIMV